MQKTMLAAAFIAALIAPAFAQDTGPVAPIAPAMQRTLDRLSEQAMQSDHGYELIEDLVTTVGPRLAGSDAEARARDWAVAMLRAEGFSNVHVEPFTIPFWDATREEARIVSPGSQRLVIAALGGSASTPTGGLEAEIVGFPDMAALEAASPESVRGRIVFIDEHMVRSQDGSGYGSAVSKRRYCAPIAQAKGAAACLIRAVGTDTHRFAHQGGSSRQEAGARLPAASVAPADADILDRLLERGPVRLHLEIEATFRDNVPSGNVVAEIRGRERPDEIVLLAAHLNSWDMGQGAIDNASGVGIITAAAKLIRDLPRRPRRTVRLLIAGSEEIGVLGGKAYAAAHANEHFILAGESDFGAGRVYALHTRVAEDAMPSVRAIQRVLAPLGIILGTNGVTEGGADVDDLRKAGTPVFDLAQDGSLYFDYHHTADDTLYAVHPEDVRQNVAAWAQLAYMVADSDWVFGPSAPAPAAAH